MEESVRMDYSLLSTRIYIILLKKLDIYYMYTMLHICFIFLVKFLDVENMF